MENFYNLLGFGFVLLCFALIFAICGFVGYSFYFKLRLDKKELEVRSAKNDSKSNNN